VLLIIRDVTFGIFVIDHPDDDYDENGDYNEEDDGYSNSAK
jgi:hypothetical protein